MPNNNVSSNRLRDLRTQVHLTVRELDHYTGICSSTITLLENGKKYFRENHINILTMFFNVTSDYLLGKNDTGIGIINNTGETIYVSDAYYNDLIKNNAIEISVFNDGLNLEVTSRNGVKIEYPKYFVSRMLKDGHMLSEREKLENQVISMIKKLKKDDIEKVIQFIDMIK